MSKKEETAVPSSPSADSAVMGAATTRQRLLIPRKQAAILLLVVCLLLVGILLFIVTKPANKKGPISATSGKQVCSDQLIVFASTAINNNDDVALSSYKKQILGLKGYDKDLNCVFILERYALVQANIPDAQKYSAMLKPLFSSQPYSKKFTTPTFSPTQIDRIISSLQENNDFQAQQDASEEAKMMAMDRLQDQAAGQKQ